MARLARLARLALALAWLPGVCAAAPCDGWPEWQAFSRHFVADGGRVVDQSQDNKPTTSEGQSYGLFFALVANDRPAFEQMLGWTRDNLAAGDLLARLPAWLWGRDANGRWTVLDDNSASDSDMWIAYDLLEAGRLWREPRYTAMGKLLALRILREEAADLPGLGLTLLPGKVGFWDGKGKARLNPSYLAPQLLARFAHALPDSDWVKAPKSSVRVLLDGAPKGFAPDWLAYQAGKGLQPDADSKAEGSYNAIRVYLWAGMLAPDAPLRAELLKTYGPMSQATVKQGQPPEKVDTRSGAAEGRAPAGFSAAMLPFLEAQNEAAAVQTQLLRMQAMPLSERPDNYYDHVLTLFGQGWQQRRYRFARNGQLLPAWEGSCAASRPASR
ncbi:cellulose synthase complex periplasmic endoglucanase BcsZ [Chromobacterium sp. IIBBL 290-4]|uniref:cellulose synthase complex periplasmic endoglucanase BcsZ n=1 Tax=Chromobacterium sp. IIBBL 290-4 TaxID=2953890 RepID=UPI0020B8B429|nr:cellulose synthase complex periplasmic endoglucanase BcsZ [Chromobacterium sp. IIBBL 290-4]UTH73442.1 cellulose synthase complex periplasmic endoglucanase BcsZ [Chromobacterium sp. IIBBL 290-4]